MLELKRLSREAIPGALEKAIRYRLLNEPGEAESVCRDILEVDPQNQEALMTLVLALTDQFDRLEPAAAVREAHELLPRLGDEYARAYYRGILCERRAKALLRRGGPGSRHAVHDWLREAMQHFERAGELRPAGNEEALLRWNACARLFARHPELEPQPVESFQPLLE